MENEVKTYFKKLFFAFIPAFLYIVGFIASIVMSLNSEEYVIAVCALVLGLFGIPTLKKKISEIKE